MVFIADTCYSGMAGRRTLVPERRCRGIDQGRLPARLQRTGKGG